MGESPRHLARELVLKRLYAAEIGEIDPDQILVTIGDDGVLSERHLAFAREYFLAVWKQKDWADGIIAKIAENWDVDRIAVIDRIILQMALVELKSMPDIPIKVAINEAIELGKKFSTRQSSAFINGILDRYVKDAEKSGEM